MTRMAHYDMTYNDSYGSLGHVQHIMSHMTIWLLWHIITDMTSYDSLWLNYKEPQVSKRFPLLFTFFVHFESMPKAHTIYINIALWLLYSLVEGHESSQLAQYWIWYLVLTATGGHREELDEFIVTSRQVS